MAGSLTRRPLATLALLIALGAGVAAVLRGIGPDHQAVGRTPVVEKVLADPETPGVGRADAPVTVVVFTDYQCPICRATHPALERLLRADARVRVLFKDWPVLGPASHLAARYALAAQRQGRYREMHAALMASPVPLDEAAIEVAAHKAGADWPRLVADLARDGAAIDAQLDRQGFEAWSLGLKGTPDYLIGTDLYQGGLDDRALAAAVRRAVRSPAG